MPVLLARRIGYSWLTHYGKNCRRKNGHNRPQSGLRKRNVGLPNSTRDA
jgi:hypothetical protein